MIAIDLGSNTIRFIEFDGKAWGKSFEKIVRTAESLHETNEIGTKAIERVISAIEEAKQKLNFDTCAVLAYTTAAMRMASNSGPVLDTIRERTGIAFKIISPEHEADLTLRAVRYRLRILGNEPEMFLLCDIGGGSTELISFKEGISNTVSLPVGIVTLSESAPTKEALETKIANFRSNVEGVLSGYRNAKLVMTAGTPTTIAAFLNGMDYETYDPEIINGFVLTRSGCNEVYDALMAMDETQRTRFVGVGREKLIMAGIMMVTAIYDAMGTHEAIIVDDGLREGIALEYYRL